MSVVLACAWNPRGETERLLKKHFQLLEFYDQIILTLPPEVDTKFVKSISLLDKVTVIVTPEWSHGRHLAIFALLQTEAQHVQYIDMDRMLRWVETYPLEMQETIKLIMEKDCLVIGRTPEAMATHPQAIQQTEKIPNQFFSDYLGIEVDLSAGSKGFSRKAVEFLKRNSVPGRALGTDSAWIILLHRAGFKVDYVAVDGLDWESADRYQLQAVDRITQEQAAKLYDADPLNWQHRVGVAAEIVEEGLAAIHQELITE